MNKNKILRVLNAFLFLSFLVQATTSLIIFFKIPVPSRKINFEIHEYNGLLLITMAFLHIYLNWNWIKATYLKGGLFGKTK
jgi:hypothetical protein